MESIVDNHFTEDVLIEILSRLPVKSLLNFTQVCKYWYVLIKTPYFITKHLNHTNNNTNPKLLVHYSIRDKDDNDVLALFPTGITTEPPVHQEIGYLQVLKYSAQILGPVNGLFLVYHCSNNTRARLWNPATKEFKVIVLPVSKKIMRMYVCGFGLDVLGNDYKVVLIRYYVGTNFPDVYVYSLCTDSWRCVYLNLNWVGGLSLRFSMSTTYLDGAYYWLFTPDGCFDVLRFDMGSEVFRVLEGPFRAPNNLYWGNLMVYHESIALLINQRVGGFVETIDIWVMRDEGFWTKHLTVRPLFQVMRPLGFWKNDELLLMVRDGNLALYNPYSDEIRSIEIDGMEDIYCRVFSYKESLVPVN